MSYEKLKDMNLKSEIDVRKELIFKEQSQSGFMHRNQLIYFNTIKSWNHKLIDLKIL